MIISSTKSEFRPRLRANLPRENVFGGNTASDLAQACESYLNNVKAGRTPSVDPYGSQLSNSERVDLSKNLKDLARTSQTDFAAQPETAGGDLKLGQLGGALQSLQTETRNGIKELEGRQKDLKHGYHVQVAKTVGWMAGTAGALVVGGLVPNPLSVLGVGFMATMTVRSIGKARAAQKNLAHQIPQIKQSLAASKEVLSKTVAFGPAVAAWDQALGQNVQARAA